MVMFKNAVESFFDTRYERQPYTLTASNLCLEIFCVNKYFEKSENNGNPMYAAYKLHTLDEYIQDLDKYEKAYLIDFAKSISLPQIMADGIFSPADRYVLIKVLLS